MELFLTQNGTGMEPFSTKNGTGMELFYTKNGTWDRNVLRLRTEQDGWKRSSNKERQEQNGTGRPFFYSERNGTRTERFKKTEQFS